jgi:choice-of-anchor B domain-containing protein
MTLAKFTLLIFISLSITLTAQNIEKLGSWAGRGYFSDCWGYDAPDGRFYAIAGAFSGTSVLDVTDPSNITEVGYVAGASSIWRDIKTYKHYAYITNETEKVAIIDLADVPNSIRHVKDMDVQNFHNLYIDTTTAHMYLCNAAGNGQVQIYTLADPENPQFVTQFGTQTHDVFVRDGVAYTAEGSRGTIGFYDISDPTSPSLIKKHSIPDAGYVHNVWLTKDSNYLVSTEETGGKTVKVWNITDLNNIELASEYLAPSELAHNAQVEGDYAFISHYESGVAIVDLHSPDKAAVVGLYDSYPASDNADYNGTWGIFPHSKSGNVYISGGSHGLLVLNFNGAQADYFQGTITEKESGLPIPDALIQFAGFESNYFSDENGQYNIGFGFAETVTVKFSGIGYLPISQEINLTGGETHINNIQLEKAPRTKLKITVKDTKGLPVPEAKVAFKLTSILLNEDQYFDGTSDENGIIDIADLSISDDELVKYIDLKITGPFPFAIYEQEGFILSDVEVNEIQITLNIADVLIVNNDPNSNYGLYISESLKEIGQKDFLLNLNDGKNLPSIKAINELQSTNLIWITGDADKNVLTQANVDSIKAYLMSGGNVILSGQNIAEHLNTFSNPFLQDWLHINYLDNINTKVLSGDIHPISTDILRVGTSNPEAANNQVSQDAIEPDESNLAEPVFEYLNSNGKYGAVGIEYPAYGSKLFFIGFGLEAVYPNNKNYASRDEIIGSVFEWFDSPLVLNEIITSTPETFQLKQNYPNPFNPSTTIEYNLAENTQVKIEIFSVSGQKIKTLVNGPQSKGLHQINFSADNLASGVYFYKLKTERFTQIRRMLLIQ